MTASRYVPDAGDIVWIEFRSTAGHEQTGRRPALVLSPAPYNDKTSLALLCPITSRAKGYPFEVALDDDAIAGYVLSDQVKTLDWRARHAKRAGRAPAHVLAKVKGLLRTLLQL